MQSSYDHVDHDPNAERKVQQTREYLIPNAFLAALLVVQHVLDVFNQHRPYHPQLLQLISLLGRPKRGETFEARYTNSMTVRKSFVDSVPAAFYRDLNLIFQVNLVQSISITVVIFITIWGKSLGSS
jgi:hypothetical protein